MNSHDNPSNMHVKILIGPNASMAYLRPVSSDEAAGYAVCAADGTELAIFSSRDAAFYAARQYDLTPVLLH